MKNTKLETISVLILDVMMLVGATNIMLSGWSVLRFSNQLGIKLIKKKHPSEPEHDPIYPDSLPPTNLRHFLKILKKIYFKN